MLSLSLRLKKLQAMSAHEVATRLRYGAQLIRERRQYAKSMKGAAHRLSIGAPEERALLENRRTGRSRWFPSVTDARLPSLLLERYAEGCARTRLEAAKARSREFSFFGQTFTYEQTIDWHVDPVSGRRWPTSFHADVPVH